MNDQFRQLAERIEAAKKAVLALENYMAQVREVIAQMRVVITEAEAVMAAGPAPE
jgi:acetate kinase